MLDLWPLLFALAVIFIAGATQSLTGFGFALVAIPLLTLVISPKLAPPISLLDGMVLNLFILRRGYAAVQPRRISTLMLAGALGVPVGTYMLANFDVEVLRVYIGVMTCLAAAFLITGFHRQIRNEQLASAPVGFVSGILSGSINMGGPPVILFFANQDIPRQVFRANIIAYFVVLQLVGFPLMVYAGIMTWEAVVSGLVLLPGLLAGGYAGAAFATRVDDRAVRRITLLIVTVAGLLSVLNGLDLI